MRVIVEHVVDPEETTTAVPGKVRVKVVDEVDGAMMSGTGVQVPDDGILLGLGQRVTLAITDDMMDEPDLDAVTVEAIG